MQTNAQRREELRPHGIVGHSCRDCHFLDACGGFQGEGSLFDCFVANCCEYNGKDKSKCNAVCPNKPDFHKWVAELRGRRFDYIPNVTQQPLELPTYVPLIADRYDRRRPFRWPVVALDTYSVIAMRPGKDRLYNTVAQSANELRTAFGLDANTRIILRGTAKDPPLERWWQNRRADDAPQQLAPLDIAAAIAPNFSQFLDVPRLDNLFNRVRQLICIDELAAAGHCVIPHIGTAAPGDWQYWTGMLKANISVRYVAKEFQTGYRPSRDGLQAIDRLSRLQDDVGRALHPVIIGGVQFVESVKRKFDKFTFLDSMPFAKTVQRQRFDQGVGRIPWRESFTLRDQSIDELLMHNVSQYRDWIESRIATKPNLSSESGAPNVTLN
jgi:hypothetical protein